MGLNYHFSKLWEFAHLGVIFFFQTWVLLYTFQICGKFPILL